VTLALVVGLEVAGAAWASKRRFGTQEQRRITAALERLE
jgi:hypothetical protein